MGGAGVELGLELGARAGVEGGGVQLEIGGSWDWSWDGGRRT